MKAVQSRKRSPFSAQIRRIAPAALVLTAFGSSCGLMDKRNSSSSSSSSGGFIKSSLNSAQKKCYEESKALFGATLNPVLEQKCATCHNTHIFRIVQGNLDKNYQSAESFSDLWPQKGSGINHTGGALLQSDEIDKANAWIDKEKVCASLKDGDSHAQVQVCSGADAELPSTAPDASPPLLGRLSGDALYYYYKSLFPKASAAIKQDEFSLYKSTGIERSIGSPQRYTHSVVITALKGKIEGWCKTEANAPSTAEGAIFADAFLLSGETRPTADADKVAFNVARNAWNGNYKITDKPLKTLSSLYTTVYGQEPGAATAKDIAAKRAVCEAALLAPQALLGSERPENVLRRLSLEIAHRPPSAAELTGLFNATDKAAYVKSYIAGLQTGSTTKQAYIDSIVYLHKDWWGLRPFNAQINPIPYELRSTASVSSAMSASGVMGSSTRVTSGKSGALNGLTILTPANQSAHISGHLDSQACENKIQDFDDRTTELIFEQQNPAADGAWEVIGRFKWNQDHYDVLGGEITIEKGKPKKPVTLEDWTFPSRGPNQLIPDPNNPNKKITQFTYQITDGGLVGTPMEFMTSTLYQDHSEMRRIRRISPSGEQNGYSKITLPVSGDTAYTCNALSRFWSTCVYRPDKVERRGYGQLVTTSVGHKDGTPFGWNALGHSYLDNSSKTWKRSPRPTFGDYLVSDSIAHPDVLNNFRCGIANTDVASQLDPSNKATFAQQDPIAYPKGPLTSMTDAAMPDQTKFNKLAINVIYWSGPLNSGRDSPEYRAVERVKDDFYNETDHFLAFILSNNKPYTDVLTANYTVGSELMRRNYMQKATLLPFALPGYVAKGSMSPEAAPIQIFESEMPALDSAWFLGALGDNALSTSISSLLKARGSDQIMPRVFSGVLSQSSFLNPVGSKVRTAAARVFTRLLCMPSVMDVDLTPAQEDIHREFVNQPAHLRNDCFKCHRNLDPMASLFDINFKRDPTGKSGRVMSEIELNDNRSFYLWGTNNPAAGAVMGTKITDGIKGLGKFLSTSPEFNRCTVQKAAEFVFARPMPTMVDCKRTPSLPDCNMLKEQTESFMHDYNYNSLIQKLGGEAAKRAAGS